LTYQCVTNTEFYNFLYMNKADKNRLLLIYYNDKLATKLCDKEVAKQALKSAKKIH